MTQERIIDQAAREARELHGERSLSSWRDDEWRPYPSGGRQLSLDDTGEPGDSDFLKITTNRLGHCGQ